MKKLFNVLNIIISTLFNVLISLVIISFSLYLYSNDLQDILASSSLLPTILIAIGSTLITILILAISITIIPIQRAIESFSKSISYLYRNDKLNILIFILISLFALFAFISSIDGIFFSIKASILFPINLATVGITLDLLRWHQRRVSKLLEPDEAIKKLKIKVINFIKRNQFIISLLARLSVLISFKKRDKENYLYDEERKLYLTSSSHYNHINKKLGELTEISTKALAKNEIETVEIVVNAVSSIIITYINCRKNNLIFYTSKDAFLVTQSDADEVFNKAYEGLFNIALRSHKESHEYPSIYCLKALAKIVENICILPRSSKINLLFSPIYYFNKILNDAQEKNLDEVVFQGCNVIEEISKNIYSQKHIIEGEYTFNELFQKLITNYIITNKLELGNKVLEQMINQIFLLIPNYPYSITHSLKNVIKTIEEIFPVALATNNISKHNLMYLHFSIPYDITKEKSFFHLVQKATIFNRVEKELINPYQTFLGINHEICMHYRKLADNNDLGESVFMWHISTSISYIVKIHFHLLSKPITEINSYTDKLINQISWYLSFFWCSFSHSSKIKMSYAEKAFEVVTQIGLTCYNTEFVDKYPISRNEIIESCISDLISMINSFTKVGEDNNQYNLSDLILYLWYIRLAAKNNVEDFRIKKIDKKIKELDILKTEAIEDIKEALELRYEQMMEMLLEEDSRFSLDDEKAIGLLRKLNKDKKFYEENSILNIFIG
ncbi:MAG: hypothetical protein IH852_03540 [Bacteroidetes bacterium]|nr:hypothetical protein [Bacteroidota bacterium]